jgi:hypothetical protein
MTTSTSLDMTAASAALKEFYDAQKVRNAVYKKNPAMAMMPKKTDVGGKSYPVPIQYGVSQGRSSTFARAQANQAAPELGEFLVTMKKDYSIATVQNQAIEASATDPMAFVQMAKVHMDSAFRTISNSLGSSMYRDGSGIIGKIAAGGITSGVITLDDPHSVTQFEKNMCLQCCSGADGTGIDAARGYVIAVDRTATAPTITVATTLGGTAGTPGSWTAAYYLLVDGDATVKGSGFSAWIPTSVASTGDLFYNQNRYSDRSRLAGIYYDGTGKTLQEAVVNGSMLLGREEGGSADKLFVTYATFGAFVNELGAKREYVDVETEVGISFRGLRIHGPDTDIDVIPDRNCQGKTGFLVDLSTWKILSTGDAPHIVTYGKEGLEMLRVATDDAAEVRIAAYYNFACDAPGWNGRFAFDY